jgi:hypothetical protein
MESETVRFSDIVVTFHCGTRGVLYPKPLDLGSLARGHQFFLFAGFKTAVYTVFTYLKAVLDEGKHNKTGDDKS